MSRKVIDIIGFRYGRLIVISYDSKKWICKCDCGNILKTSKGNLHTGDTKSCGCLASEVRKSMHKTHGMSNTHIYNIWGGMHQRCYDTKCEAYANYGGRGITVSKRWLSFENFYEDMGTTYKNGLTIERIDNDGIYELANCTWIPLSEQAKNRRSARILTIGGVSKSVTDWANSENINSKTIFNRLQMGWSEERCISPLVTKFMSLAKQKINV